jgi:hypothetical protein
VSGEGIEGRVPARLLVLGAEHHRAHAVVENLGRVAAEVRKRPLVRIQQRADALVLVAFGEHAARVAEGEHEDVDSDRPARERHAHLTPVHLALLSRRGFEPALRQRRRDRFGAQRPHGIAHGVIAAVVIAGGAQFLKQDAR